MRIVKFLILSMLALGISAASASEKIIGLNGSDPTSYIEGINVVNGNFTQVETDLVIAAPDPLALTRFYDSDSGWRIFPQAFLVMGNDQTIFAGERSGAILKYKDGKIIPHKGMVNTYAGEISGKTNFQNHRLICKGETCELVLGDGTKRTYKLAQDSPSSLFWSFSRISNVKTFQLISEKLPSGNTLLFSYEEGRISLIEMKDTAKKKLHAWIRFAYQVQDRRCIITVTTSDEKILENDEI